MMHGQCLIIHVYRRPKSILLETIVKAQDSFGKQNSKYYNLELFESSTNVSPRGGLYQRLPRLNNEWMRTTPEDVSEGPVIKRRKEHDYLACR